MKVIESRRFAPRTNPDPSRRAAAVLVLVLSVSGCGVANGSSSFSRLRDIEDRCPVRPGSSTSVAYYTGLDVTSSGASRDIEAQRRAIVAARLEEAAVCDGRFRLDAFSGGLGSSRVLFDEDLSIDVPTDIARLRRVPALVEKLEPKLDAALARARSLPQNGSDVVAQYTAVAEYGRQLGARTTVDAMLLTDGVQNRQGIDLVKDPRTAAAQAERLPAPRLDRGTRVTLVGIGRVRGTPLTTTQVDALKTFHQSFCRRTAATCTVVTDYAMKG